MNPIRLLQHVADRLPEAGPGEVFRMAMLVCHQAGDSLDLDDQAGMDQLIRDISLQIAIHEDQHAAIASELDSLASTEPCQFNTQHLWTLIRAIKVQSQLLAMYLGPEVTALEKTALR
jgi:hypothetical protein